MKNMHIHQPHAHLLPVYGFFFHIYKYTRAAFLVVLLVVIGTSRAYAETASSTTSGMDTSATSTLSVASSSPTLPPVPTSTLSELPSSTSPVVMPVRETSREVEHKVRAYFADRPAMIDIARCESTFRQYRADGSVLYGGYNNTMVGIFQIYEDVHAKKARSLGFDITTANGNIGYAEYLYKKSGTDPWISSFGCWKKDGQTSRGNGEGTLTADLHFGQENEQVRTLQTILNNIGYIIAESGPGSIGNETTSFGAKTRAAVRAFQCKVGIACSGDEYSTGYGHVDDRTRGALRAAPGSPVALWSGSTQTTGNISTQKTNNSPKRMVLAKKKPQKISLSSKTKKSQVTLIKLQKQLATLQKQLTDEQKKRVQ